MTGLSTSSPHTLQPKPSVVPGMWRGLHEHLCNEWVTYNKHLLDLLLWALLKCKEILSAQILGLCCAKLLQSCLTLYNPMDRSLPGISGEGILQARMLERVAMPSSRESSWPRDWAHVSYVSWIGRQVLYHSYHLGTWPLPKCSENLLRWGKS